MGRFSEADIPDLTGRRAIVTGGSSGTGWHTARGLARRGAQVMLTSRDSARAAAAADAIRAAQPDAQVEGRSLDLCDLASVRAFAAGAVGAPLDLLINNAGLMAPHLRGTTRDGFELQFGANHLGHFALTGLLLPALLRASVPAHPARIVSVASIAHHRGRIDLADLQSERGYRPMRAYSQSKLANLMFALELQRRLVRAGTAAISVAAHPGVAATNLAGTMARGRAWPIAMIIKAVFRIAGQTAARGAAPILYAATMPGVAGGSYIGPDGWREMRGNPAPAAIAAQANDTASAAELWRRSEQLTGVVYLD
jgi:NAD(P)-dependent dehydrogenase (short-subunit alcohol dehydrogenase family)